MKMTVVHKICTKYGCVKKKKLVISTEQTRLSERLISKVKGEMVYGFYDK